MRILRAVAGVGLVAVLAAGCGGGGTSPSKAAAADSSSDARPSIAAQGVGKATGVPDMITVGFNLHTQGDSAQQTLSDNSTQTQAVLDSLVGQGVDPKDVQTTSVNVGPRFDNRSPPRIVGYSADNSFTAKLRDLSKAGAQIDALVAVGGDALQVQGISYSMNDDTALLGQARTDAVTRAAAQAQQMADAAGVKLAGVRTISEVQPPTTYPYNGVLQDAAAGGSGASAPVPIAPGSQELTVTVTVVYDIG